MTGPPESFKRRFRECRDVGAELRRHDILHSHVRPVAASSTQGLPGQERFCGHPVTVVSSHEGAVHVTARQSRGGSSLDPQHRPAEQSLRQRSEIFCFKALQTVLADEELNGPFPSRPACHALSRRRRDIGPSAPVSNRHEARARSYFAAECRALLARSCRGHRHILEHHRDRAGISGQDRPFTNP
jgi:hypothetical protein